MTTDRIVNARILVTGGAGFLGRFVCAELEKAGAGELIVPRRADYDLTEQNVVRDLIASTNPDIIVHLAAEVGGIGANLANPGRYFYANAAMGLNLIEAARVNGVEKFVQVGTVCAYPKFTPVPFREEDIWDGYPEETNAPYGVAKKSLLVMLQSYRQQYDFDGIYLLPVNLYGPGDNFDLETSHVIPALIRKFITARDGAADQVILWGTGSPSREFLYVADAARGVVTATARYDDPEPVNLGNGREVTIRDLAETIGGLVGYQGEIVWDSTRPDGQPRRALDVTRAKEYFDWAAEVSLETGLAETIAWWENNRSDV